MCQADAVIVRNQTIIMKICFLLWAFLPLVADPYATESDLYNYLVVNTQIRALIQDVSTFMSALDHNVQQMAEEFHQNVSALNSNYGAETYKHFQRKYAAKAANFAKIPKLSKDCPQYVKDLLKANEKHQTELSDYVATAVDTWRIGFNNLYSKFVTTRVVLTKVEKEAYDCGILFSGRDSTAAFNCAIEAFNKTRQIHIEAIGGLFDEIPTLTYRKNSTLKRLHNSVRDRFIPSFYDEDGIDRWLKNFCS